MRAIEEQAGGNLFRGGQRKKRLIAIKRGRNGMGKAGHKLCWDLTEDGEGKLESSKQTLLSRALNRAAELHQPSVAWNMAAHLENKHLTPSGA